MLSLGVVLRQVGGDLTPAQDRAHTYLARAVEAAGIDTALVYACTFFGGNSGLVVPFYNMGGTKGNCTVPGGRSYQENLGSGTALTTPLQMQDLTMTAWAYGAFNSVPHTAPGAFVSLIDTSSPNNHIRLHARWNGTYGRPTALLNNGSWIGEITQTKDMTTVGRIAFSSVSNTSLRFFQNGVMTTESTTARATSLAGNTNTIAFCGAMAGGYCPIVALGATAALTDQKMQAFDTAVRTFLTLVGRPTGD